jgi:ribosome-binding protein aMBF1 (putative translation factor)
MVRGKKRQEPGYGNPFTCGAGGWIYAVQEVWTPLVKIGCSTQATLTTRLHDLASAYHVPFRLVGSQHVPRWAYKVERRIHHALTSERIEGEWFYVHMTQQRLEALTKQAYREVFTWLLTNGQWVKHERERRRFSQVALAREAGISQALLSRIEAGTIAAPNADVIKGLARALWVTTDYLLCMDEKEGEILPATAALLGGSVGA